MKIYQVIIHGHLIEARTNELGAEFVFLDGCEVSKKLYASLYQAMHFFDLEDEQGKKRHVEVRWTKQSKYGFGKYHVQVYVDGALRCKLKFIDAKNEPDCCTNCGYSLKGLEAENGEVRCPECGKHTAALLLGEFTGPVDGSDSNKKQSGA